MASYEEPVNGIVQPPFIPLPNKRHRNTNQLQFIKDTVFDTVWNHILAWPFRDPVSAVSFCKVVRKPMDLRTIKRRLENCYYYSATECIQDFKQIFVNCFTYNSAKCVLFGMASILEESFFEEIAEMPKVEEEIPMTVSL